MTAQGHPRAIFNRAIEHGNLLIAEATLRELGRPTLGELLELTVLIAFKTRDGIRASRPGGWFATSRPTARRRSTTRRSRSRASTLSPVQATSTR